MNRFSPNTLVSIALWSAVLMFCSLPARAVPMDLPYPSGELTAKQIIEQVYFTNHSYAVRNLALEKKGKKITTIVLRQGNKKPSVQTIVRYLKNDYDNGDILSRDLVIFKSGKIKGTGILVTYFVDETVTPSYIMWFPKIRKLRRFAAPALDDTCCGANLTYGDLFMRRPQDETHELLGEEIFDDCLGAMKWIPALKAKRVKSLPEPSCSHKGRPVYKVKSVSVTPDWWYDARISYVDKETFGDIRIEYYKDGKQLKVFEKDWQRTDLDDPRAARPNYWYVNNLEKDIESMVLIPEEIVKWNTNLKDDLWSEKTLRKLKR